LSPSLLQGPRGRAAAGEALTFARALGLNPWRAYEGVREEAANYFMLDDRAGRMLSDGPVDVESALSTSLSKTPGWY
jgi:3-hydroxyisobutyrate dehydrogenase-like beta-hydroxyacid dehydrogenase